MRRPSVWVFLGLVLLAVSLHESQVSAEVGPSESECRPYIEKAIHELQTGETDGDDSQEGEKPDDTSTEDTGGGTTEEKGSDEDGDSDDQSKEAAETAEQSVEAENDNDDDGSQEDGEEKDEGSADVDADGGSEEETADADKSGEEADAKSGEQDDDDDHKSGEDEPKSGEDQSDDDDQSQEKPDDQDDDDEEKENATEEEGKSGEAEDEKSGEAADDDDGNSKEAETATDEDDDGDSKEAEAASEDDDGDSKEAAAASEDDDGDSKEAEAASDDDDSGETKEGGQHGDDQDSGEDDQKTEEIAADETEEDDQSKEDEKPAKSGEDKDDSDGKDSGEKDEGTEEKDDDDSKEAEEPEVQSRTKRSLGEEPKPDDDDDDDDDDGKDDGKDSKEKDDSDSGEDKKDDKDDDGDDDEDDDEESGEEKSSETRPMDDLLLEVEIPDNLRDRQYINEILRLDNEFEGKESAIENVSEIILRDLKRIYENAIKPLEGMYKYRDLSNRHFGDPEIFSKPLVLFMGPWSGGKSTIINYLTDNEYTINSLRSGAEPSPAYFNILMHGEEPEVLDGTQLAADWTFSGLQKFGQGLEDRLRGLKLPNKLLEKVNIVEIPGILEVRKQVSRLFPFNDACQWFIDRADIIFLIYDPAKLDVGPETEAILDQLKGREYQTRIILNKADSVKPEELLRVQGALIWNISPLMSSAQPPVMYTTSLWSHPYETSSPVRLLQAQERAFLKDLRTAIDKRIENKIASARRFAVRVRNHAKMVDCYLTTYYNHKTLFGNKKRISDQIIEHPENYHIYEGLSTLTNISRYDLPDPETYRDFFRLNPLYEFKKLQETCTYFRGCPINKLDVAIAYDLPELVGKYKKMADAALANVDSNDSTKGNS